MKRLERNDLDLSSREMAALAWVARDLQTRGGDPAPLELHCEDRVLHGTAQRVLESDAAVVREGEAIAFVAFVPEEPKR